MESVDRLPLPVKGGGWGESPTGQHIDASRESNGRAFLVMDKTQIGIWIWLRLRLRICIPIRVRACAQRTVPLSERRSLPGLMRSPSSNCPQNTDAMTGVAC